MRTVRPEDVRAMLTAAAARFGLSFETLCEQGQSDEITEPELRDLWLIWGDSALDEAPRCSA